MPASAGVAAKQNADEHCESQLVHVQLYQPSHSDWTSLEAASAQLFTHPEFTLAQLFTQVFRATQFGFSLQTFALFAHSFDEEPVRHDWQVWGTLLDSRRVPAPCRHRFRRRR